MKSVAKQMGLIATALVLLLTASNAGAAGGKVRIGVSAWGLSGEYNATLRDRIYEYVKINKLSKDVEITLLDAQSDAELQNSQVQPTGLLTPIWHAPTCITTR